MPSNFRPLMTTTCIVFSAALTVATIALPSLAKDQSYIMDTSAIGRSQNGVVTSDQILELGTTDSSALRLEGEQSMRFNNIDRAIMVLQRSVEMAPSDMDGRILYAEALEKKLMKQKDRDPSLFNFVVKQWLYVAKKADFLDQSTQASKHLANLTGQRPRKWDTSARYLSRVLIPEDGSAKVAFHGKPGEKPQ